MSNLVPECAIEVSFVCKRLCLFVTHGGGKSVRSAFKEILIAHDVRAQKNRAAIASSKITLVRKNGSRVATTCLTEVSNNIVNTDRYVFADFFVVLVRQRIFERL